MYKMPNHQNIFISLLDLLKVKHTRDFTSQYFNEHPHKNNLFGLSKMMSDYGIENAATRISNKEKDLPDIQTPFIAQFGGDFAAVSKVEPDSVSFFWKGNKHVLPITKFIESWSGVVLMAEPTSRSIEPDYKSHKKSELIRFLIHTLLIFSGGLVLLFAYLKSELYASIGFSLLLFTNITGVFISWLLLLKHLRIQSQYVDKICSLFKQSNCNSVLESNAAKLFGVIGWSEVGLGYFVTNVFVLLFAPHLVTHIALINIATLPFSFWSVWYQYAKAKQWCPLCLIVQVLLWSVFAVNCVCGYIQIPEFSFKELITIVMLCCGYSVSILGLNALLPQIKRGKMVQHLRQSINSIKADEDVFVALLKKQPHYEIDNESIIRFGNSEASLQLTILSNPYCNPCAKLHKRLEELMQKMKNNISVQYFLSSFKEEWNTTNKYLIAACLADDSGSGMYIFRDWFENGKALRDEYYKDWGLDIGDPEVEAEFLKHEAWKKKTQIRATPTVLVNGYKLPDNYKIEDLRYFTDFNIDIK
ncbi:MAG: thioredoxin domain-containing protein [Prevotellaceae bacterium]|jgi:uncharacterized membrane protein|nr:thioredoxin domain-containing protein [Prevotellaceae bacterium]